MFGVTTPCVSAAQRQLEQSGYEVLVFHATGTGGRSMESLVEAGLVAGVLDVTTGGFRHVSAGHPGPLHLPAAGPPVILESPGSPIGLAEDAYGEGLATFGGVWHVVKVGQPKSTSAAAPMGRSSASGWGH